MDELRDSVFCGCGDANLQCSDCGGRPDSITGWVPASRVAHLTRTLEEIASREIRDDHDAYLDVMAVVEQARAALDAEQSEHPASTSGAFIEQLHDETYDRLADSIRDDVDDALTINADLKDLPEWDPTHEFGEETVCKVIDRLWYPLTEHFLGRRPNIDPAEGEARG